MYVIALRSNISEGFYAVENEYGEKILYIFSDEDDAERYVGLLEADNYPKLKVIEIKDDTAIETCKRNNYTYMIITPDDLMIPPDYHDTL
jgi:hypothetical protein